MDEAYKIEESSLPTEEKIARLEVLLAEKKQEIKEIKKTIDRLVEKYRDEVEDMEKGQTKLEV